MTVNEASFAAIDFESAGTAPGLTDEPVQVGIACMAGDRIEPESLFVSYIRASRPVTWAARKVHGIGSEALAGAPPMHALWPPIRRALGGRIVVAHGAATEKRYLRAFPFHGFGPWIDTLALARALRPGLADYALGPLVGSVGGDGGELAALCPGRTWHDALFDAAAALVLLRQLVREHHLGELDIEELAALA